MAERKESSTLLSLRAGDSVGIRAELDALLASIANDRKTIRSVRMESCLMDRGVLEDEENKEALWSAINNLQALKEVHVAPPWCCAHDLRFWMRGESIAGLTRLKIDAMTRLSQDGVQRVAQLIQQGENLQELHLVEVVVDDVADLWSPVLEAASGLPHLRTLVLHAASMDGYGIYRPLVSPESIAAVASTGRLVHLGLIQMGLKEPHIDAMLQELATDATLETIDVRRNFVFDSPKVCKKVHDAMSSQMYVKDFWMLYDQWDRNEYNYSGDCDRFNISWRRTAQAQVESFGRLNAAGRQQVLSGGNPAKRDVVDLMTVVITDANALYHLISSFPQVRK